MADSAKIIQSKRKFETRLNPMFQNLILTASKQSDSDEVTEPAPTSRSFFEQKNPSEAKSYLYHKLNVELNLPIYVPTGLTTALHTGVLFWDRQDTPSNFSFFLVPPQSSNMMSNTVDSIALSLETSDGRGGIDSEDIRCLTKQNIYIPTTINELEHHINHGLHILALLCRKSSYLVEMIKGCLSHIKVNQSKSKQIKQFIVRCKDVTSYLQLKYCISLTCALKTSSEIHNKVFSTHPPSTLQGCSKTLPRIGLSKQDSQLPSPTKVRNASQIVFQTKNKTTADEDSKIPLGSRTKR